MIRINLNPSAQRKASRTKVQAAKPGQWVVVAMLLGWIAIGGGGYWLLLQEEEEEARLRAEDARVKKETEEIRKAIDEEGLQARKDRVEQLRVAIEKLQEQQRTPVFVMHEMANILTTGKMPDIDEEEQRRIEAADPQSKLLPNWDATSVWITSLDEAGGTLALEGAARDAADLAEFVRRLRASSRFGAISHPVFQRAGKESTRFVTWKLNVGVRRWN